MQVGQEMQAHMRLRPLQINTLAKAQGLVSDGSVEGENVAVRAPELAARARRGGIRGWRWRVVVETGGYPAAVGLVVCEAALA